MLQTAVLVNNYLAKKCLQIISYVSDKLQKTLIR